MLANNKITLITLTHEANGHKATLTQEFYEGFEFGHWIFVVFDDCENVIHAVGSSSSPPDKVDQLTIEMFYDRFYDSWKKAHQSLLDAGFIIKK